MKIFNFFKMSAQPIECSADSRTMHQGQDSGNNKTAENKMHVHNLILLDESGSMMSIYNPALTGVNETLQTIRGAQNEHPNQEHFVTLIAFDSNHYNQIYHNVPADNAADITKEQYRPDGCTPLYDAMGKSINKLRRSVAKGDIVLVTIITDGYENASREYNGKTIKSLVEEMRNAGWVFTYIGANQDVESVAESMSINNSMSFDANESSTKAMFAKECKARRKFFCKLGTDISINDLSTGYFD